MANDIVKVESTVVTMNTLEGFAAMQKQASILSGSDMLPATFAKKPANVLIALDMANRLNMSPMSVMQNMYIVYGNPAWSAKYMIACFNSCGRFSSIKYDFVGTKGKDDYGCRASATELATGEKVSGPVVDIAMAKAEGWYGKNGSKWQTMPQLMLQYRAATFLIRTTAPEITMGMNTVEEQEDTIDMVHAGSQYVAENSVDGVAAELKQEIAATPTIEVAPVANKPQKTAAKAQETISSGSTVTVAPFAL